MIKKKYETIIIGGGIAGLGCARTLTDYGRDFLLITEDVGGRILHSADGNVNYGAYFVGGDYHHLRPYVNLRKKINLFDLRFHKNGRSYGALSTIRHPLEFAQLLHILRVFIKRYTVLKKQCERISQKEAIASDPYLFALYTTRASDFARMHGLEHIVDEYVEEVMWALLFSRASDFSAFEFLHWTQYLLTPSYEFSLHQEKLLRGFEKKVTIGSVVTIRPERGTYAVMTTDGAVRRTRNIVLATPVWVTKKLITLKKIKKPARAHMFHIVGQVRKKWDKERYEIFHSGSEVFDLVEAPDGTYVFYTKTAHPNFEKYFRMYTIIAHRYWNPAFHLNGDTLLDAHQGKNLYMIGDYNVAGMEDSFITGIYAANQIKKNSRAL